MARVFRSLFEIIPSDEATRFLISYSRANDKKVDPRKISTGLATRAS